MLTQKVTPDQLKKLAEDLDGYIKFVVDVKRGILTAGGARHVDGEQMLLKDGSKQGDLWGGGYDLQSGELDFDSMIDIRPTQDNPSREVLDLSVRKKVEEVARRILIK